MLMAQSRLETYSDAPRFSFSIVDGYVSHPLIKPGIVQHRVFQTVIAQNSIGRNSLVVLPTGIGKTIIALLVCVETLQREKGKVLFMAPTRPLVQQHHDTFGNLMVAGTPKCMLSGNIPPKRREA